MTTGVDILFREKISPEPVRQYDRPRADVNDTSSKYDSKEKIGDERSFTDHLKETNAPKTQNPTRSDDIETDQTNNGTVKTDTHSQDVEENDQPITDKVASDENHVTEQSSNNSEQVVINDTNTSQVALPVVGISNENIQNNPNKVAENTIVAPIAGTVVASAVASQNSNIETGKKTNSSQESVVTQNSNDTGKKASANIISTAIKNVPENSTQHTTGQNKGAENLQTTQAASSPAEKPSQAIQYVKIEEPDTTSSQEAKVTPLSSNVTNADITGNTDADNNVVSSLVQSDEQSVGETSTQKKDNSSANIQLSGYENQNIQETVSVTVPNVVQNDDILENIKPTETVAIESTKILNVAPTQPQNSTSNRNEGVVSKPASKKAGKTGIAQATNTSQSQTAQNVSQQANLQNSTRSDILLDLGTSGQKNDPIPLQPLTVNGQTSLSNGAMMAAQDVNIQRTAASSFASALKTETPITSKMVNEQIFVAINRNIVNGQNNFSIRLHPAELGQVDIRLEFAADGKMNASMIVENERTLSMLQRDQASLEKALQDAGVNLSGKNMNFSLMKQGQENNKQKFADIDQSSDENLMSEDIAQISTAQEVNMGYSNQSIDISV